MSNNLTQEHLHLAAKQQMRNTLRNKEKWMVLSAGGRPHKKPNYE